VVGTDDAVEGGDGGGEGPPLCWSTASRERYEGWISTPSARAALVRGKEEPQRKKVGSRRIVKSARERGRGFRGTGGEAPRGLVVEHDEKIAKKRASCAQRAANREPDPIRVCVPSKGLVREIIARKSRP